MICNLPCSWILLRWSIEVDAILAFYHTWLEIKLCGLGSRIRDMEAEWRLRVITDLMSWWIFGKQNWRCWMNRILRSHIPDLVRLGLGCFSRLNQINHMVKNNPNLFFSFPVPTKGGFICTSSRRLSFSSILERQVYFNNQ